MFLFQASSDPVETTSAFQSVASPSFLEQVFTSSNRPISFSHTGVNESNIYSQTITSTEKSFNYFSGLTNVSSSGYITERLQVDNSQSLSSDKIDRLSSDLLFKELDDFEEIQLLDVESLDKSSTDVLIDEKDQQIDRKISKASISSEIQPYETIIELDTTESQVATALASQSHTPDIILDPMKPINTTSSLVACQHNISEATTRRLCELDIEMEECMIGTEVVEAVDVESGKVVELVYEREGSRTQKSSVSSADDLEDSEIITSTFDPTRSEVLKSKGTRKLSKGVKELEITSLETVTSIPTPSDLNYSFASLTRASEDLKQVSEEIKGKVSISEKPQFIIKPPSETTYIENIQSSSIKKQPSEKNSETNRKLSIGLKGLELTEIETTESINTPINPNLSFASCIEESRQAQQSPFVDNEVLVVSDHQRIMKSDASFANKDNISSRKLSLGKKELEFKELETVTTITTPVDPNYSFASFKEMEEDSKQTVVGDDIVIVRDTVIVSEAENIVTDKNTEMLSDDKTLPNRKPSIGKQEFNFTAIEAATSISTPVNPNLSFASFLEESDHINQSHIDKTNVVTISNLEVVSDHKRGEISIDTVSNPGQTPPVAASEESCPAKMSDLDMQERGASFIQFKSTSAKNQKNNEDTTISAPPNEKFSPCSSKEFQKRAKSYKKMTSTAIEDIQLQSKEETISEPTTEIDEVQTIAESQNKDMIQNIEKCTKGNISDISELERKEKIANTKAQENIISEVIDSPPFEPCTAKELQNRTKNYRKSLNKALKYIETTIQDVPFEQSSKVKTNPDIENQESAIDVSLLEQRAIDYTNTIEKAEKDIKNEEQQFTEISSVLDKRASFYAKSIEEAIKDIKGEDNLFEIPPVVEERASTYASSLEEAIKDIKGEDELFETPPVVEERASTYASSIEKAIKDVQGEDQSSEIQSIVEERASSYVSSLEKAMKDIQGKDQSSGIPSIVEERAKSYTNSIEKAIKDIKDKDQSSRIPSVVEERAMSYTSSIEKAEKDIKGQQLLLSYQPVAVSPHTIEMRSMEYSESLIPVLEELQESAIQNPKEDSDFEKDLSNIVTMTEKNVKTFSSTTSSTMFYSDDKSDEVMDIGIIRTEDELNRMLSESDFLMEDEELELIHGKIVENQVTQPIKNLQDLSNLENIQTFKEENLDDETYGSIKEDLEVQEILKSSTSSSKSNIDISDSNVSTIVQTKSNVTTMSSQPVTKETRESAEHENIPKKTAYKSDDNQVLGEVQTKTDKTDNVVVPMLTPAVSDRLVRVLELEASGRCDEQPPADFRDIETADEETRCDPSLIDNIVGSQTSLPQGYVFRENENFFEDNPESDILSYYDLESFLDLEYKCGIVGNDNKNRQEKDIHSLTKENLEKFNLYQIKEGDSHDYDSNNHIDSIGIAGDMYSLPPPPPAYSTISSKLSPSFTNNKSPNDKQSKIEEMSKSQICKDKSMLDSNIDNFSSSQNREISSTNNTTADVSTSTTTHQETSLITTGLFGKTIVKKYELVTEPVSTTALSSEAYTYSTSSLADSTNYSEIFTNYLKQDNLSINSSESRQYTEGLTSSLPCLDNSKYNSTLSSLESKEYSSIPSRDSEIIQDIIYQNMPKAKKILDRSISSSKIDVGSDDKTSRESSIVFSRIETEVHNDLSLPGHYKFSESKPPSLADTRKYKSLDESFSDAALPSQKTPEDKLIDQIQSTAAFKSETVKAKSMSAIHYVPCADQDFKSMASPVPTESKIKSMGNINYVPYAPEDLKKQSITLPPIGTKIERKPVPITQDPNLLKSPAIVKKFQATETSKSVITKEEIKTNIQSNIESSLKDDKEILSLKSQNITDLSKTEPKSQDQGKITIIKENLPLESEVKMVKLPSPSGKTALQYVPYAGELDTKPRIVQVKEIDNSKKGEVKTVPPTKIQQIPIEVSKPDVKSAAHGQARPSSPVNYVPHDPKDLKKADEVAKKSATFPLQTSMLQTSASDKTIPVTTDSKTSTNKPSESTTSRSMSTVLYVPHSPNDLTKQMVDVSQKSSSYESKVTTQEFSSSKLITKQSESSSVSVTSTSLVESKKTNISYVPHVSSDVDKQISSEPVQPKTTKETDSSKKEVQSIPITVQKSSTELSKLDTKNITQSKTPTSLSYVPYDPQDLKKIDEVAKKSATFPLQSSTSTEKPISENKKTNISYVPHASSDLEKQISSDSSQLKKETNIDKTSALRQEKSLPSMSSFESVKTDQVEALKKTPKSSIHYVPFSASDIKESSAFKRVTVTETKSQIQTSELKKSTSSPVKIELQDTKVPSNVDIKQVKDISVLQSSNSTKPAIVQPEPVDRQNISVSLKTESEEKKIITEETPTLDMTVISGEKTQSTTETSRKETYFKDLQANEGLEEKAIKTKHSSLPTHLDASVKTKVDLGKINYVPCAPADMKMLGFSFESKGAKPKTTGSEINYVPIAPGDLERILKEKSELRIKGAMKAKSDKSVLRASTGQLLDLSSPVSMTNIDIVCVIFHIKLMFYLIDIKLILNSIFICFLLPDLY